MKKMKIILLIFCVFMTSCIKNTQYSGNAEVFQDVSFVNNLSKDEILARLGSPTVVSYKTGDTWMYAADQYEKVAFMPRKITEQRVLMLHFKDDKVDNYKLFTSEDIKRISYSKLATPAFGDDTTVLKEMFSNLGRFNARKKQSSD